MFDVNNLAKLLDSFNIPIEKFGKGEAKTMQNLLDETSNGDCRLVISKKGIHREVSIMRVHVIYYKNNKSLILKESKQVFDDGRGRKRNLLHISEKFSIEEEFEKVAERAVAEELGIESKIKQETRDSLSLDTLDTISYPGLERKPIFSDRIVFLTYDQFKEDGYTEYNKKTGITTYFVWISLDDETKNKLFL